MESPVPFRSDPVDGATRPQEDSRGLGIPSSDLGGEARFLTPVSLEVLFHQSYKPIVQALALVCGDLAAAEDATQEAFTQAWLKWSRVSRYDNPGAWVRRVAINKLRNAHRSRLRGEAAVKRMASGAPQATFDPGPGSDLIGELQRLPSKQRMCAALYYVEGLSTSEVAKAMGISEGSVSRHLNRARTKFRTYLETTS